MPGVSLISPSHLSFMDVMGPLEVATMFRSSFHNTTNYLSLLLLVEITLVLSGAKRPLPSLLSGPVPIIPSCTSSFSTKNILFDHPRIILC